MPCEQHTCSVLAGARVLDLTDETGTFGTKLLAALGADVVRIEPPGGDPARHIAPFYHDEPDPEKSLHWFLMNLNKRSITLDISRPAGKDILLALVAHADFLVESFPPGYLHGLGLGYAALHAANPRLIMTSISPFGQEGPYRDYKGGEVVISATSGLLGMCGDEGMPPVQTNSPVATIEGAAQAALGSMIAYWCREFTGEGRHVDVSSQESAMVAIKPLDLAWKAERTIAKRRFHSPYIPGYPTLRVYFQCKNGYIASLPTYWSARKSIRQWLDDEGLAADLYSAELDPYFEGEGAYTAPEGIEQLVYGRFEQLVARYDKQDLYMEGQWRGIQVTPVNNAKDILEDAQLHAREYFLTIAHPELGQEIVYQGVPFKMSESTLTLSRRAPRIGEHNAAIYGNELGMAPERLDALREEGII